MSDSDSPETPEGPVKKPKGAFGWYKPPEEPARPLSEPGPNYSSEVSGDSKIDQEALLKATAIEYYNKGQEIAKLIKEKNPSSGITTLIPKKSVFFAFHPGKERDIITFTSNQEPISGYYESRKPVVTFNFHTDNLAWRRLLDTNWALSINYGSDSPQDKPSSTYYLFNERGEFRKINVFHQKGEVSREEPASMGAGDFEIAGQALELIKKRTIDPMWDQEETTAP